MSLCGACLRPCHGVVHQALDTARVDKSGYTARRPGTGRFCGDRYERRGRQWLQGLSMLCYEALRTSRRFSPQERSQYDDAYEFRRAPALVAQTPWPVTARPGWVGWRFTAS